MTLSSLKGQERIFLQLTRTRLGPNPQKGCQHAEVFGFFVRRA